MQGALKEQSEGKDAVPQPEQEERVSHWINKAFMGLIAIAVTLMLTFGSWLVGSINEIKTSTATLQTEFTPFKQDITDLKGSVDSLRIQAAGWATKDSLTDAKESLREDLSTLKDRFTGLELRMTKLEAETARK